MPNDGTDKLHVHPNMPKDHSGEFKNDYQHQSDSTEVKSLLKHGGDAKEIAHTEKVAPGYYKSLIKE